jgi:SpoVK/Ycf46/Vps4 family AAA+-type ATPase
MLLCKEACLFSLERNLENPIVSQEDFDKALKKVKGRLTKSSIAKYLEFNAKFKN